jgi:murein DD-endopeptidase MepM/ murein hydrolase activator NlpD
MSWTRALVCAVACIGFGIAAANSASAEGPAPVQPPAEPPAPRAAQLARSFITAPYAPFNQMIAQSIAAAADLTAASERARAVVAERAAVDAELAVMRAQAQKPGAIADRIKRETVLIAQTPKVAAMSVLVEVREAAVEAGDLEAKLQKKQAALAAEQDALTKAGIWSLPSADAKWAMPLVGELTQPYGPTTFYWEPARAGHAHFHDGIDIAAPYGSEIRAAAPGQVIFAGAIGDGAQLVVIAHIGGYVSEYAHLMAGSPVKAGDFVAQGQVIGRVGMTGLTTGPHLHMQVWHGGALVDPLSLIAPQKH